MKEKKRVDSVFFLLSVYIILALSLVPSLFIVKNASK